METQLPEHIGLRLAAALKRYPEWRGVDADQPPPTPIRLLGDQSNNANVLVANSRAFALRIYRSGPAANGLNRSAERMAMERAAEAGLAPALRFFDEKIGVAVCDFLPPDAPAPVPPERLATLLKGIHALPPIRHRLSLADRIAHYAGLAETCSVTAANRIAPERVDQALQQARELEVRDSTAVLCHNDLLPQNCISSAGRLFAIDWEYAATGSRWFDLGACSAGHALDASGERSLLRAYLGHDPGSLERALLRLGRQVYDCLERLWYACQFTGR